MKLLWPCVFAIGVVLLAFTFIELKADPVSERAVQRVDQLGGRAIESVLDLAKCLSDDDERTRGKSGRALIAALDTLRDSLDHTCDHAKSSQSIGLSATILGEMCPNTSIPMMVNKISMHEDVFFRTEADPLLEYPFASGLRKIGQSSAPEIMQRFGWTPPKEISDKEIEIVAQVLREIYHRRAADRELLFATIEIEKKHAHTAENLDRLEAKLKEITDWKKTGDDANKGQHTINH